MSVCITTLLPDQWKAFRSIRLASLADESRFEKNHREEAILDEAFWRSNIQYGVFALAGDEPVGLVLYTTTGQPDAAKVYGLHVEEDWRRQGIGGQLFERVVGLICESEKVDRVILMVDSGLSHAIRLYRSHGFVEAGDVRDGELRMEKRL